MPKRPPNLLIIALASLALTLLAQPVFADRMAITVDTANVRSGPGTEFAEVWKVEKYHPIEVIEKKMAGITSKILKMTPPGYTRLWWVRSPPSSSVKIKITAMYVPARAPITTYSLPATVVSPLRCSNVKGIG